MLPDLMKQGVTQNTTVFYRCNAAASSFSEMAQPAKILLQKPDDLILVPRTHMKVGGGET